MYGIDPKSQGCPVEVSSHPKTPQDGRHRRAHPEGAGEVPYNQLTRPTLGPATAQKRKLCDVRTAHLCDLRTAPHLRMCTVQYSKELRK